MNIWNEGMPWGERGAESKSIEPSKIEDYRSRIEKARGFHEIWEIVKETVKDFSGEHRNGMLLFLDDLPLQLGAYHSVGTNNIVLNRSLVQIVQTATKSRNLVNAFVYSILVHEYLHALGHIPEAEVHALVIKVSKTCFGDDHTVTQLAEKGPWSLLSDVPLGRIEVQKGGMEIVKNFEEPSLRYIT